MEYRDNNRDFNDAVHSNTDGGWLLQRFRLGVTLKPESWLKVYAQTQDSREFFSTRKKIPGVRGAEGDDAFDLRQAYAEIGDLKRFPLSLQIGRQVLEYGDRRLVSDSRWSNFGRTFDAARVHFEQKDYWLETFVARPVQIKRGVFDDSDAADNFGGAYFSTSYIPKQRTDLYFFYRDKGDNQPDLSTANSINPVGAGTGPAARFSTIGTRMKSNEGELGVWDYMTEIAYEFGDVWVTDRNSQRQSLHAFAAHASGGYTFKSVQWKPRVGLEYDYASGDSNSKDGSSQSFQNLYPSNHEKYGFMDEFSWRNVHDARFQFNIKPVKKLDLEFDYHAFWLANTNDYWYTSNGVSALRTQTPPTPAPGPDVRTVNASNFAGHEVDLAATYEVNKNLKVQTGYSHFFAGTYLKDTGPHDDADFAYVMATLKF